LATLAASASAAATLAVAPATTTAAALTITVSTTTTALTALAVVALVVLRHGEASNPRSAGEGKRERSTAGELERTDDQAATGRRGRLLAAVLKQRVQSPHGPLLCERSRPR
jgi:hypothetical protein